MYVVADAPALPSQTRVECSEQDGVSGGGVYAAQVCSWAFVCLSLYICLFICLFICSFIFLFICLSMWFIPSSRKSDRNSDSEEEDKAALELAMSWSGLSAAEAKTMAHESTHHEDGSEHSILRSLNVDTCSWYIHSLMDVCLVYMDQSRPVAAAANTPYFFTVGDSFYDNSKYMFANICEFVSWFMKHVYLLSPGLYNHFRCRARSQPCSTEIDDNCVYKYVDNIARDCRKHLCGCPTD